MIGLALKKTIRQHYHFLLTIAFDKHIVLLKQFYKN